MKKKRNETVGINFQTSQEAKRILESSLPPRWLLREQSPDFHIDYLVEVVEDGEPTGFQFAIQLKGTRSLKRSRTKIRKSLRAKHLTYYLEKTEAPVFLVLADVTTRNAYWCFLQKYLKEAVNPSDLASRKSISISLDPADSLADGPRFLSALDYARTFMKELHPGPLKAAIEADVDRLRVIDPRLDVSVEVRNGCPHYQLSALEEFDFTFKIKGAESKHIQRALTDFYEQGADLKIDSSLIQIEGAPLLAHLFKQGPPSEIKIQHGPVAPGTVQFFETKRSPGFILQMEGHFRSGSCLSTFEAAFPDAPLELATTFSEKGIREKRPHNLNLRFSPGKWAGQRICHLAHFDAIHNFFALLGSRRGMRMVLLTRGNHLFSSDVHVDEFARQIAAFLDLLRKARYIFGRFQLNPVFRDFNFSADKCRTTEELFQLLTKQRYQEPHPNFQMTINVTCPRRENTSNRSKSKTTTLGLSLEKENFKIIGGEIELGPLSCSFTNTLVTEHRISSDEVRLEARGNAKSVKIVEYQKKAAN